MYIVPSLVFACGIKQNFASNVFKTKLNQINLNFENINLDDRNIIGYDSSYI